MFFYACSHQRANSPCAICHNEVVTIPCTTCDSTAPTPECPECGGFGQTRSIEVKPTMPDDWHTTHGMCVDCEGTGKVDGLASVEGTAMCATCLGSGSKPGGITDSYSVTSA